MKWYIPQPMECMEGETISNTIITNQCTVVPATPTSIVSRL